MKPKIYCPIRKTWVTQTPEEGVRQRLIAHLTSQLQFPLSTLAVEKGLVNMPHITLQKKHLPDRRADLVSFAKGIHPDHSLYPLLLVECKAVAFTPLMLHQLTGYNLYMKAPFIALVNQEEIRFYAQGKDGYEPLPSLLSYYQLVDVIKDKKEERKTI